jgi:hypothetical protein
MAASCYKTPISQVIIVWNERTTQAGETIIIVEVFIENRTVLRVVVVAQDVSQFTRLAHRLYPNFCACTISPTSLIGDVSGIQSPLCSLGYAMLLFKIALNGSFSFVRLVPVCAGNLRY